MEKKTIKVRQYKSSIRQTENQKRILKGMGLGKINSTRELPNNSAVRGMVEKVKHLVKIEE